MNDPINSEFNSRAVSVYGSGDALDDFPVLKAFQQYIDAEQAKARKRLLALGIFFGALIFIVIAIFVILLMNVTNRNQQLNDRLIEFAMKDRSTGSAVVVQPPQDSSAILTLTTKLEEMQRKLSETQIKAEKAVAEAEEKARQAATSAEAKPKPPTAEELEIKRLRALLDEEKKKAEAEKERRRQEELEAYRRQHYPELYETNPALERAQRARKTPSRSTRDDIDQILDVLDDVERRESGKSDADTTGQDDELAPIDYFEDDDDEAPRPVAQKCKPQTVTEEPKPLTVRSVSVPNGKSRVSWGIPD